MTKKRFEVCDNAYKVLNDLGIKLNAYITDKRVLLTNETGGTAYQAQVEHLQNHLYPTKSKIV